MTSIELILIYLVTLSFQASESQIRELILQGKCESLTNDMLKVITPETANGVTGSCLNNTKIPVIKFKDDLIQGMPADVFDHISANRLDSTLYRSMTLEQLTGHLKYAQPSKEQLLAAYNGGNLKSALEEVIKSPELLNFRPSTLTNCPISVMDVFGSEFWTRIQSSTGWKINSTQLIKLPETAFESANPNVLAEMEIFIVSEEHRQNEQTGKLIQNMGTKERTDGFNPCQNPFGLLKFIGPRVFRNFSPSCISAMHAITMSHITQPSQLNNLVFEAVKAMKADQVRNLPLSSLNKFAGPFMKKLFQAASENFSNEDPQSVACAGLTLEHIKGASSNTGLANSEIWSEVSLECFAVLENQIIIHLPPETFAKIPEKIFDFLSAPVDDSIPGNQAAVNILTKITSKQMPHLGNNSADEDAISNFCYNLHMKWAEVGAQNHEEVAKKMNPKCFGRLNPTTYHGLGEAEISLMEKDIFGYLETATHFANIPAPALKGISSDQVGSLNPSTLRGMKIEQLLTLANTGATKHLNHKQWSHIPIDVVIDFLSRAQKTGNFVSDLKMESFTTQHFVKDNWVSKYGNAIKATQWSQLGIDEDVSEIGHPCSVIKYDSVKLKPPNNNNKTYNFWKGINERCLTSLSFVDRLGKEELRLVQPLAFKSLPTDLKEHVAKMLGKPVHFLEGENVCKNYSPENGDLSVIPPECYADMETENFAKVVQSEEIPANALEEIQARQVAAIPHSALKRMNKENWEELSRNLVGSSCEGFKEKQAQDIDTKNINPLCAGHLNPQVFSSMTPTQILDLPFEAWQAEITREQVSAIPSGALSLHIISNLGHEWSISNSMHPCLGITKKQIQAMSPQERDAFHKNCQTVIAEERRKNQLSFWFWVAVICVFSVMVVFMGYLLYRYNRS